MADTIEDVERAIEKYGMNELEQIVFLKIVIVAITEEHSGIDAYFKNLDLPIDSKVSNMLLNALMQVTIPALSRLFHGII